MDYTTLIAAKTTAGSLANWGNSSTIVASAPTIIDEAQAYVYRRLRHWRMLAETTGTLTAGASNDYITISDITNYLEDKILMLAGIPSDANGMLFQQRIVRKTPEEVWSAYAYDSSGARVQQTPRIMYNNGTQLKFDAPANYAYPWKLLFYQQPAALSGGNATNWLTTYYPRLLRCALMIGVCEFMKDAGMGNYDRTYWSQQTDAEIANAQIESDRQHRSIEVGAIIT